MQPNRQAHQLPTRSSRRQRGLSPLNPHGSQFPITQTSTTPHTNSTHSSTAHDIFHSNFHEQQSYPSIINTINSNPDNLSTFNIQSNRVSNAESLPPTLNPTNTYSNNYPASIPAYRQHYINPTFTSYPPSVQSRPFSNDSLPSVIQINPQDNSSSSSQLRSVIQNLESMIQTLQTTTTELRQDLQITREENAQLRANL